MMDLFRQLLEARLKIERTEKGFQMEVVGLLAIVVVALLAFSAFDAMPSLRSVLGREVAPRQVAGPGG